MTFGLMRRAGVVAAVSAAVLAFTVSTADASTPGGREVARPSVSAVVPASSFDGKWIMDQSNAPHVSLFLGAPASDGSFTGFASWEGNSGDIDGRLTGGDVVFFIHWSFGHTGRYDGHLGSDGKWSGVTVDINDPSSQATWIARRG
ncbi:hypothetical protein ACWCPS_39855 [Streptomyces mauvecolor]